MRGYERPSGNAPEVSSNMASSELEVVDEDMERAGVDVCVAHCARARASATDTADR